MSSKGAKKKRTWKIIGIIVLAALIPLPFATKLIYDASFQRYEEFLETPRELETFAGRSETFTFRSGDNMLTGSYFNLEGEKGTVFFIPGYHAGVDDYIWQIAALAEEGWSLYMFEPTGTDRSGGDSAVGYPQILADTRAAWADFLQRADETDNVAVMGHSRGAYAACALLKEETVDAAVLVSGQNSAMEGVMQPAADMMGLFAYTNYGGLWLYQVMLFGREDVNFNAADAIRDAAKPVMIVQGTRDETAPMESYSIYAHRDEFSDGSVVYYLCDAPGQSGHTDLLFSADGTENRELMEAISDFLLDQCF